MKLCYRNPRRECCSSLNKEKKKRFYIFLKSMMFPLLSLGKLSKRKLFVLFIKKRFGQDRKSTRLNSSHVAISYAVFCSKKNSHLSTGARGVRDNGADARLLVPRDRSASWLRGLGRRLAPHLATATRPIASLDPHTRYTR